MAHESERQHRQDGAALRRIRRERGIKVGELAAQVGLGTSTIANGENGHTQVSIEALYRIAAALDVPIKDILSDAGRAELADDLKAAS